MSELWRDRYEPLEVVGRGGQGSVVRALDHLHNRSVALKIRPRGAPEEQEALLAEARVLLGMSPHPLVTLARDDFFLDDRYVLVMDWIEGASLGQRLIEARGAGFALEDVLGWLKQVAEALDHLHRQRPPVIHGDVKPANIVLTATGTAVLVDFGIARRHDSVDGPVAGSRQYMAPELAAGGVPSVATDVFSLAATAFTLLVGQPPGPGVRVDWAQIAGTRAGEVETALRQGLAVDPSRRPASAGQFVEALRGRATPPNNLPVALSTFVGREAEIARVVARLSEVRLLTLVGTGGVGKTRLAVEVAEDVLPVYPDGIFLVELGPLQDPALLPQQLLVSLGIGEVEAEPHAGATGHSPGATPRPLARLTTHLVTRTALLVLDNCEHLIEACASVVEALLRTCPNLRILATSREPLRVPGEVTWRVGPLSAPDPASLPPIDDLTDYEAVRLFADRAAAAGAFQLTADNAPAVAALCARLDGIPLAIELAAARTGVLSVGQIARRLDDRFRLLTGGGRTRPDRHQSLKAALDWTHDALTPTEQALFRRVSAFSGGFRLEAAEAVGSGGAVEKQDVLELLASLVDKSLVISAGGDTGRYRMLETLRQYAAQKLEDSGEFAATRRRHLAWALELAEDARPHLGGNHGARVVATLEADHDNLRAALLTAESPEETGDALVRLAVALSPFWRSGGYLEEGRTWVEAALARAGDQHPERRLVLLQEAGEIGFRQGDFAACQLWLDEALVLARSLRDETGQIAARQGLARVASRRGDLDRARRLHEANLEACRRRGDRLGEVQSLMRLTRVMGQQGVPRRDLAAESVALARTLDQPATLANALTLWGQSMQGQDPAASRAAYEEALAIHQRLGDRLAEADTLAALANFRQVYANFAEAYELFERVLAIRREVGNRGDLASALILMGQLINYRGDYPEARRYFDEAVGVARQIGDTHAEGNALENLALISMYEGDFAAAKPLLERALALARHRGDGTCEQQMLMSLGDAFWGEGDVGTATALYRESLTRAASIGRTIRVVYLLERLGSAGALGDYIRAARLLGAAQGMRDNLGLARPLYSEPEWAEDVDTARRGLGDARFEQAWTEGRAMTLGELVRYATEEQRPSERQSL